MVASCNLSPGSYPNAEIYEFKIKEDTLIEIIKQVKTENQEIDLIQNVQIPNGGTYKLPDERKGHWYSLYFYIPTRIKLFILGLEQLSMVQVNSHL
jgi:hypothetical protein